jgi:hypothetical protein
VAEHDVHREAGEGAVEIGKLVRMHQEFHVPAERCNAQRQLLQHVHRQRAWLAVLHVHDIDAHPAHAGGIELFQFRDRYILGDHCDAAEATAGGLHRFQHHGVVGPVDAGLHQHCVLHAERREHLQVIGQQAVGRGVDARGRIRVARVRPHDVRVRVARARGELQPGRACIEIGRRTSQRLRRGWR